MRSSTSVLEWEEMGPDNVGGRTRLSLLTKTIHQESMQVQFPEDFGFLSQVVEPGENIQMN